MLLKQEYPSSAHTASCTSQTCKVSGAARTTGHICCKFVYVHHQCRGLLSEVPSSTKLQLEESAAPVRLLIGAMYDTNSQVKWCNVTSLLELARKYDVEDITLNCGRFQEAEQLSTASLPRFIRLACKFSMDFLLNRCQDFIADAGNFRAIAKVRALTNLLHFALLHFVSHAPLQMLPTTVRAARIL